MTKLFRLKDKKKEKHVESMWRAMVWAFNEKENAVIDSLKKVCK